MMAGLSQRVSREDIAGNFFVEIPVRSVVYGWGDIPDGKRLKK